MASKKKFFACGTSNYGISNLELLADDTHKFELQYMIKLLGGTKQEIPQVYHDRSPVYFSANIKTPLLVCVSVAGCTLNLTEVRDRFFKATMIKLFRPRNHGLSLMG